jgi:hypothetical protein
MDIERPPPPARRPTEEERHAALAVLKDAFHGGRLTVGEYADRFGAVGVAEYAADINAALAGLGATSVAGTGQPAGRMVALLGRQQRAGGWRLPSRLTVVNVLGDTFLDLCGAVCAEEAGEIRAYGLLGDLRLQVPDGVEVELTGAQLFGRRSLRLAAVPRIAGTPLIRVRAYVLFGDVTIQSTTGAAGTSGWRRWLSGSPPQISRDPPVAQR